MARSATHSAGRLNKSINVIARLESFIVVVLEETRQAGFEQLAGHAE